MSSSKPRITSTSTTYEFPMRKPKEKKSLKEMIYDSEKGRILGRTVQDWVRLIVFYLIFYIVLASLFTICLQGLFLTLSDDHPKWQLEESIIGTNPGLGFRPISEETDQGSLIWYKASNATEVETWTRRLDQFLEPYRNKSKLPEGGKNQVICDFDNPPSEHQVCAVEVSNWGPCSPSEGYSYNKSSPCIFLKLNRIYNWKPEFYNDPADLPAEMPQELKAFIAKTKESQRNQIWISCEGMDGVDKENLGERIEYYPDTLHGFPEFYYPYTNTPGYLSPLIAIRLLRPPLNQIINLECKAWAKNIKVQGGRDRLGSVHFEVMIDQ